ncbi:MAG: hypothetical protein QF440_01155 [Candidatus Thalassarchaeaceae archaeon]|jgi:uncharacterized membrane protein|nr:hypothetical protein [Candidatus Thalassarchaeaceae archaeon]
MDSRIEHAIAVLFGLPFIWIGIQHFVDPTWFEPIVPRILGNPTFWVILSGIPEVGLGIAVIIPQSRKWAALCIAFMLVALYWANANMWINGIELDGNSFGTTAHIIRAFAQVVMISIALWIYSWNSDEKSVDTQSE